jgi:hypothetical protein
MRSATRSLGPVLTVAAAMSVVAGIAVSVAGVVAGAAQAQSMTDRSKIVGTYRLIATETRGAGANWTRPPNFNSVGYHPLAGAERKGNEPRRLGADAGAAALG